MKRPPGGSVVAAVGLLFSLGLLAGGCVTGGTRSSKGDAERYLRLGYVQMERGQTQQALDTAMQALKSDPDNAEAHSFAGLIYLNLTENDKAIEHLRKAVKINPYYTDAHNTLGIAYREKKEYDKALKEFQTAMNDKTYKTPEKVQLNLGYLYLDQGVITEAVRCFERAVELKPDYLMGYIGLGTAYDRSGRPEQARAQYRKVMTLAPESREAVRAKQLMDGTGSRGGS